MFELWWKFYINYIQRKAFLKLRIKRLLNLLNTELNLGTVMIISVLSYLVFISVFNNFLVFQVF